METDTHTAATITLTAHVPRVNEAMNVKYVYNNYAHVYHRKNYMLCIMNYKINVHTYKLVFFSFNCTIGIKQKLLTINFSQHLSL